MKSEKKIMRVNQVPDHELGKVLDALFDHLGLELEAVDVYDTFGKWDLPTRRRHYKVKSRAAKKRASPYNLTKKKR